MDAKMTDNVNHPDHYARYRFECEPKDLTKFLPHPLASAIEYIIRAPFKGSELEDLKKARFWLEEFSNTQRFWNGTFRGADGQTTDTVCWITDKFEPELTATAISFSSNSTSKIFTHRVLGERPRSAPHQGQRLRVFLG